jgi:NAD(P)-dependent dehydrogenase (short-subunit alcohol dehydrogenase family)
MDQRTLLDDLLEATVLGSFSNIGFRVRRRLFGWDAPRGDALAGRTALVTGPTSGLGRQIAGDLAQLGARVVLVGRDAGRLRCVQDELRRHHGEDRFPYVVADMSSLASVRAAAEHVRATEARLDVLVDNAGAIFPERRVTADGIEATLATLVVGPFLLISRLQPLLHAAPAGGRVISVTSGGMYAQAVRLDDLQWEREPFDGTRAYARAKRIQVALVREWARRLRGSRVIADAMHPGWTDTPGLADALPAFHRAMQRLLRTPEEGADTVRWLAAQPVERNERGGRLFLDRRPRPFDRIPSTRLSPADRRALWDCVVALAAEPDPVPEPSPWQANPIGARPSKWR